MNIRREIIKRITPYMRDKGFSFARNNFYYIHNDIAFCIAIEMPSGLVYVTAYVMPLYIPCESIYYTYGKRLNTAQDIKLPLLKKDSTEDSVKEWCGILCRHIENYILPFYKTIDTPINLLDYFERKTGDSFLSLSCPEIFVNRLRMFTWLYAGNLSQAENAIKKHKRVLLTDTFFTDMVRQNYLEEIIFVQSAIHEGQSSVQNLLLNGITKAKKLFL